MGHRLSKIYTRTGDDGTTGLGDGSRVRKDAPRVQAYGDVDELNSIIGIVLAHQPLKEIQTALQTIQHHLFDLGGELSVPGMALIQDADIAWLEQTLDHLNAGLPMLKEFVLPGGSPTAAFLHQARTVCRRAERQCIQATQNENFRTEVIRYLNRLSDLLFVMARLQCRHEQGREVLWNKRHR